MMRYTMCVFLLFPLAFAQGAENSAKKKTEKKPAFSLVRLQGSYKKALSLESDFTQEVYQASLARTKTSKGNLKLAKPNLVRWEIFEPEASVMVSNGRRVSYFTPDARGKGKGQVIERKAKELENQPIFRILTGAATLEKEFTIEKQEKSEEITSLTLKPKTSMGDLERVILRVSPKYLIEEMILEAQSGNKTKFTLQNQALGDKLPAQLFEFKAPPGTEIVQN